jgi:hypothetical protein
MNAVTKEITRHLQENARQEELKDVAWVMADTRGRRMMWRLFEICSVFRTTFTGNSTTFFNEGKRSVALELLADIEEVADDQYQKMKQEARERNG